jgi:hypothetical protein
MSDECDKCGKHALECVCLKELTEELLDKAITKIDKEISRVDNHILNWSHSEWEEAMIAWMKSRGWENDINDETTLGFSFTESNGDKWIRDYNKKSRSFIHYNGSRKITLKTTN